MIVFPNCKINIGLFVTEKRGDGFHNLESIFFPIHWTDALEVNFNDSNDITLKVSGAAVTDDIEKNIIVKAYRLMQQHYAIGGVDVDLWKKLPMGAGLGGGSADAAFMLKALNNLFELNLSASRLMELAAVLGSDCPFFIENTVAFVSGRGELIEKYSLDLQGLHILLIHPGIHVSTAEAFAQLTPKHAPTDLRLLHQMPIEQWKDNVFNDFESSIFPQYPEIKTLKEALYKEGAIYAAMSGSGSAVYGLFKSEPNEHSVLNVLTNPTSALWYKGIIPPSKK